ncbi:hypothetical protein ACF1CY_000744 [Providencia rettgeri]
MTSTAYARGAIGYYCAAHKGDAVTWFHNLQFDLTTVQSLVIGAVSMYAWFIGKQSAPQKELVDVRARLIELEIKMAQMPTQAQISDLISALSRNDAILHSLSERMGGMERQFGNVNNYLLNRKKE